MQGPSDEPREFQEKNLRPEYLAALNGDLTGLRDPDEYELSGGGRVRVYRNGDEATYCAIIDLDGIYPQAGKIARNRGRTEKIKVLDGKVEVDMGFERHALGVGDTVILREGVRCRIKGSGCCFVLVRDKAGGKTEILNESPASD